jgi:methionine-rich copper-binding protein CopC
MNQTTFVGARRVMAAVLLGTVGAFVAVSPALAHSTLVSSSPADGSTLGVAPTEVVLTFNENVVTVGNQVVVTSPSGRLMNEGNPEVLDATVTEQLRPLTENGTYLINYRIVSGDGHPVQRQLSFTLDVPGLKTATPSPGTPSPAPSTSSGPNLVLIVGGAAFVGLLIGLAATLLGRRKDGPSDAGQSDESSSPPDDLVD